MNKKYIIKKAIENGYPVPNKEILDDVYKLIGELEKRDVNIMFVNPSIEGGIILEFEKNQKYYILDYDNNEEIGFLVRQLLKRWAYDLNKNTFIDFILSIL